MTRKLSRNYSRSVVAAFTAVLTLLIAAAVRAQTTGAGEQAGKPQAVSATRDASLPLLAADNPLLGPAVVYRIGWLHAVAVADLNGDGKPDLVVTDVDPTVKELLGNGDGTFRTPITISTGLATTVGIAIGDLNHDGKADLVMTDAQPSGALSVLMGKGDGSFQSPVIYSSGGGNPYSVTIGDVNGDGHPDLVVPNGVVSVLLNNGDGSFQAPVGYDAGYGPGWVVIEDLNGDGHPDLVVNVSGAISVLMGNGQGTFQAPVSYSSGGGDPEAVAVADMNGDGKPDIIVAICGTWVVTQRCYPPSRVGILLGNGDGTFQQVVTYDAGGSEETGSLVVADVNGDGKLDVIKTTEYIGISVFLGNGDRSLQPVVFYGVGGTVPLIVAVADLNGDNKPDVAVSFFELWPSVGVLLNNRALDYSPSTTTLVPSLNPAPPFNFITYTATVSSQEGKMVTGTVTFQEQGTTIARVPLTNSQSVYKARYTTVGEHEIRAFYSGDADNDFSMSAILTEYVMGPSTTVVATSGSPSFVGQLVTFTVSVTSPYGAIPDGKLVAFYDGTNLLGSVALVGGTAAYTTSSLSAKTHTIKATFGGDTLFKPSSGAVTQVVNKYPTTTALSSSLNPSVYGQAVNLTSHVTSGAPSQPTGTVTFKNGLSSLGTVALVNGFALLTKKNLPAGTLSITATYNGDTSNNKSTSPTLSQVVSPATTTTTVTSSLNPSVVGQSITFKATVKSPTVVPIGTVTFTAGTTTLGTVNLAGGKASLTISALSKGATTVTATYNGTSNITGSSGSVVQTVN